MATVPGGGRMLPLSAAARQSDRGLPIPRVRVGKIHPEGESFQLESTDQEVFTVRPDTRDRAVANRAIRRAGP